MAFPVTSVVFPANEGEKRTRPSRYSAEQPSKCVHDGGSAVFLHWRRVGRQ